MSSVAAKDNVLAQLTLLEQFIVFSDDENETVKTMKKRGLMALVKIPPAFCQEPKETVKSYLSTLKYEIKITLIKRI